MIREPLRIQVDRLPPEGRIFELDIQVEATNRALGEAGVADVEVLDPVVGRARVQPSGRDVFVTGRVRTRVRCRCVRCLSPFTRELDEAFHLTFVEGLELGAGEHELHPEELELEILVEGSIDLARAAFEQVLLGIPAHPVCDEACRGLCPWCGADRNREPCACTGPAADPRLAVLAGWRPRGASG